SDPSSDVVPPSRLGQRRAARLLAQSCVPFAVQTTAFETRAFASCTGRPTVHRFPLNGGSAAPVPVGSLIRSPRPRSFNAIGRRWPTTIHGMRSPSHRARRLSTNTFLPVYPAGYSLDHSWTSAPTSVSFFYSLKQLAGLLVVSIPAHEPWRRRAP